MNTSMPDERGDQVIGALDALSNAIEENTKDERQLRERIDALRQARRSGAEVTATLRQERTPGTMELLGRVLARLMDSSGQVRRTLARTMRAEGTSIPAIARLFGVTHQRVSNILSRPPAAPAPVLHDTGSQQGRHVVDSEENGEERAG